MKQLFLLICILFSTKAFAVEIQLKKIVDLNNPWSMTFVYNS